MAQELRSAGYDGMLTGRAADPVYLEIDNSQVTIKPAAHLWGLDTFETYDRLLPDHPEKEWRIACVGPAGENRVVFACIDCDWHRQAGRDGARNPSGRPDSTPLLQCPVRREGGARR